MAQMNPNILEQFDPAMRAKIAREAELRDTFWEEMKAHRQRVYPTLTEHAAAVVRINVIFTEVNDLAGELLEAGYIPPPHKDQPPAAETKRVLRALRRVIATLREYDNERRNQQQQAHAAAPPPPERHEDEDTESEAEVENETDKA